jgi:hypothetical protein
MRLDRHHHAGCNTIHRPNERNGSPVTSKKRITIAVTTVCGLIAAGVAAAFARARRRARTDDNTADDVK